MNSKKSTKTSLVVKKSAKNQTLSDNVTSASSGGQYERPTSVIAPAGNSRLNAIAPKVTSKTDALQSSNLASNRNIDTKKRTNSATSSNQTGNVVLNSKPHREASSEKSRQTISRKASARRPVAGVTTSLQTETKHITSPQLVPRKLTSPQPASKKITSAKHTRNVTQNQNVAINSMSHEPATRQVTSPPSPPSATSRKTTTLQSESRKNTPPQSMSKRVIPPNFSARKLMSPKPSTRQLTTPKPSTRSLASSKPSTRQLTSPNPSTRSLASPKPVASKLTPPLHDAKKTAPLTSVARQQSLTENVKRKLTSSHTTNEQPCSLTTVALGLRSPQTVPEAKTFGQTESFSSATLKHASEQGCFKTRALDMKSLARTETNVDQNVIRDKCTTSSKSSSLKNNAKGTKTKTDDTTSVKSKRSSARCVSQPSLKSNLPTICATRRTNAEQMIYSSNSNAFSLNGELNNRKFRSTTPSSVTSSASDSVSSSSSSGILKVNRAVSNNRNKMCNKAVNSNSISNIINSKANVLPPAMKTKLSPTAQTVTDRLMNPAKFKISKSENNTDRSTQLTPSTAKGKQIYGFTKQEKCKLKTDKNESTPSSPRHLAGISVGGRTLPRSCDSFIPSENNKFKAVSNVRKTNKICKDEVIDNTTLVTKCCTDQVFSETWNCLAKHQISTGDKCSDMKNAAIEERNTCIFCQKQNKGSSAFDLSKGGNSSSLSAEVSNVSDLGNGLLTTSDALSGSEIIFTSESTLVGYPSKDTLNIRDGKIWEQNIGISKNKAVSKKKGLENNADLCLTNASISPECCSVSEDGASNFHRIYNVSNIPFNATNQASMDDAKVPSNNRLCTSNILRVSKSCCNFDDVKHDSKTLWSGILHFKLQSKIPDLDGLLSKHISSKVPSFMKRSNSEDNLICCKDFTLASDSEQILNTLSAIYCIRCKCAQAECNCTTEKRVNEIFILKSDRDLAGNRHTGIQVTCGRESTDKNLLPNTVNSNFENTHCLQTALGRNSFFAVDVNLLHFTSENKEGNKAVDPFCDIITNVEGVHPSTATSDLCNFNDKIQTINISQREESKNLQTLDKTILYQVGDVSKHMSRVDPDIITSNTPFSRIQTSESDALSDGKIAENSLCAKLSSDMESINVKTDCVMPVTQCSSLDNKCDMMNEAKLCVEDSKHGINCDTKYGINCDANFINESESVSDKHLQSNYSVHENMCGKLDNSVVSSETCAKETECELFKCMSFINDDNTISMANTENNETLNTAKRENVLLAAEGMCCELDLPSPQHALVKECLQTHEIQVMNQVCDLLQGSKNNQAQVGSGIIDISNLVDSYRDDAALIKPHSCEQSHLKQDIVDTRTIAGDICANASHLQVRRTNSYSSLVCTFEAPIATGKTRSNSAGNIPEIFKGEKLVCQLQHFPASQQEKINAYNAFNFMEQTNINSICTLSVIPSLKELCITHLQNELSIFDNVTTETPHAKREHELQKFNFVDGPADNTFISANSVPHTLSNSQSMNDKLVISRRSDATDQCSADTNGHSAYAERPFVSADDASAYVDNSPSSKQISNMEPGTYLQQCSDINSAQNILCNSTDNFYYNNCSSEATNLSDNASSCSNDYFHVGSITKSTEQVLGDRNMRCVKENGFHDLTNACNTVDSVDADNFITYMSSLSPKAGNRESGYFSVEQSQENISTQIPQCTIMDCSNTNSFQSINSINGLPEENGSLQNDNVSEGTLPDGNPERCTFDGIFDEFTPSSRSLKSADGNLYIYNAMNSNLFQTKHASYNSVICHNCFWLVEAKKKLRTLVLSGVEDNIYSSVLQGSTEDNLIQDYLHHQQAVSGQSNQIWIDKRTRDLIETSKYSDKNVGLSYRYGINRCQECSVDLYTSDILSFHRPCSNFESHQNSSGYLYIQDPYGDQRPNLPSRNILKAEINSNEPFSKTSNVCCKSSQKTHESDNETSSSGERSDFILPENFKLYSKESSTATQLLNQSYSGITEQFSFLQDSAFSISDDICDTFSSLDLDFQENNSSCLDDESLEKYLANSLYTDSYEAVSSSNSYSDQDSEALFSDYSINQQENDCDNSVNAKPVIKKGKLPPKTENVFQCHSASAFKPFLEVKRCAFCGQIFLIETGVHRNVQDSTNLLGASNCISLEQQLSDISANSETKNETDTGVDHSLNCQFSPDWELPETIKAVRGTLFKLSNNEIVPAEQQIGHDGTFRETNDIGNVIKEHYYDDANEGNYLKVKCSLNLEGGESLSDFLIDDDIYFDETYDHFVDAEECLYESDNDDKSKETFIKLIENTNDTLYSESETSTSVESFKDAVDILEDEIHEHSEEDDYQRLSNNDILELQKQKYCSYTVDFLDSNIYSGHQSELCHRCMQQENVNDQQTHAYASAQTTNDRYCYDNRETFLDEALNVNEQCQDETMQFQHRRRIPVRYSVVSNSKQETFDKSEHICTKNSANGEIATSRKTQNYHYKATLNSQPKDSTCDSNLGNNTKKLDSSKPSEGIQPQADNNDSEDSGSCSATALMEHSNDTMSKQNIASSTAAVMEIVREGTRFQIKRNSCQMKFEPAKPDKERIKSRNLNINLRVNNESRVLNSVNVLESKVSAEKLTASSTVGSKIETAVTIRSEKRRLRQVTKQNSSDVSNHRTSNQQSGYITSRYDSNTYSEKENNEISKVGAFSEALPISKSPVLNSEITDKMDNQAISLQETGISTEKDKLLPNSINAKGLSDDDDNQTYLSSSKSSSISTSASSVINPNERTALECPVIQTCKETGCITLPEVHIEVQPVLEIHNEVHPVIGTSKITDPGYHSSPPRDPIDSIDKYQGSPSTIIGKSTDMELSVSHEAEELYQTKNMLTLQSVSSTFVKPTCSIEMYMLTPESESLVASANTTIGPTENQHSTGERTESVNLVSPSTEASELKGTEHHISQLTGTLELKETEHQIPQSIDILEFSKTQYLISNSSDTSESTETKHQISNSADTLESTETEHQISQPTDGSDSTETEHTISHTTDRSESIETEHQISHTTDGNKSTETEHHIFLTTDGNKSIETEQMISNTNNGSKSTETDQQISHTNDGSKSTETEHQIFHTTDGTKSIDTEHLISQTTGGSKSTKTEHQISQITDGSKSTETEHQISQPTDGRELKKSGQQISQTTDGRKSTEIHHQVTHTSNGSESTETEHQIYHTTDRSNSTETDDQISHTTDGSKSTETEHHIYRTTDGSKSTETDHQTIHTTDGSNSTETDHQTSHTTDGSKSTETDYQISHTTDGSKSTETGHQISHTTDGSKSTETGHQISHTTDGSELTKTDHQTSHATDGSKSTETDNQISHTTDGSKSTETGHQISHTTDGSKSTETGHQISHTTNGSKLTEIDHQISHTTDGSESTETNHQISHTTDGSESTETEHQISQKMDGSESTETGHQISHASDASNSTETDLQISHITDRSKSIETERQICLTTDGTKSTGPEHRISHKTNGCESTETGHQISHTTDGNKSTETNHKISDTTDGSQSTATEHQISHDTDESKSIEADHQIPHKTNESESTETGHQISHTTDGSESTETDHQISQPTGESKSIEIEHTISHTTDGSKSIEIEHTISHTTDESELTETEHEISHTTDGSQSTETEHQLSHKTDGSHSTETEHEISITTDGSQSTETENEISHTTDGSQSTETEHQLSQKTDGSQSTETDHHQLTLKTNGSESTVTEHQISHKMDGSESTETGHQISNTSDGSESTEIEHQISHTTDGSQSTETEHQLSHKTDESDSTETGHQISHTSDASESTEIEHQVSHTTDGSESTETGHQISHTTDGSESTETGHQISHTTDGSESTETEHQLSHKTDGSDSTETGHQISELTETELQISHSTDVTSTDQQISHSPNANRPTDKQYHSPQPIGVLNSYMDGLSPKLASGSYSDSSASSLIFSTTDSSKKCQTLKYSDSEILSVRLIQNKSVIHSSSENIPVINSQNQDTDLCIKTFTVCSDKADEQFQSEESKHSNSEQRLSNKLYREGKCVLNSQDVNRDTDIYKYVEKKSENFDNSCSNYNAQDYKPNNAQKLISVSPESGPSDQEDSGNQSRHTEKSDASFNTINIEYTKIDISTDSCVDNICQQEKEISDGTSKHFESAKDFVSSEKELANLTYVENPALEEDIDSVCHNNSSFTVTPIESPSAQESNNTPDFDIHEKLKDGEFILESKISNTEKYDFDLIPIVQRNVPDTVSSSQIEDALITRKETKCNISKNDKPVSKTEEETEDRHVKSDEIKQKCEDLPQDFQIDTYETKSNIESDLIKASHTDEKKEDINMKVSVTEYEGSSNMRQMSNRTDEHIVDNNNVEAEICEDSNISVALALKREKEHLNDKSVLFPGNKQNNRRFRRATTAVILQNRERKHEGQANMDSLSPTTFVRKSKSFQLERTSEYQGLDGQCSGNISDQVSDSDNIVNKKVSDICKSFIEKTKSSVAEKQSLQKRSSVVSPIPTQKLMNWVCKEGKWTREPLDLQDDPKKSQLDSDMICSKLSPREESQTPPSVTSIIKQADQSHGKDKTCVVLLSSDTTDIALSDSQHNLQNNVQDNRQSGESLTFIDGISTVSTNQDMTVVKTEDHGSNDILKTTSANISSNKSEDILLYFMGEDIEYMDGVDPADIVTTESVSIKSGEKETVVDHSEAPVLFINDIKNDAMLNAEGVTENEGKIFDTNNKLKFDNQNCDTEESVRLNNLQNEAINLSISESPFSGVGCSQSHYSSVNLNENSSLESNFGQTIHDVPDYTLHVNNTVDYVTMVTANENQPPVSDRNDTCDQVQTPSTGGIGISNELSNLKTANDIATNEVTESSILKPDMNTTLINSETVESKGTDKTTDTFKENNLAAQYNNCPDVKPHSFKKKPIVPLPSKLPSGPRKQSVTPALEETNSDTEPISMPLSSNSVEVNNLSDSNIPKRIPKLKAVKITEEEIFEGKPEYTKECNRNPLGIGNKDTLSEPKEVYQTDDHHTCPNKPESPEVVGSSTDKRIPEKTQLSKLMKKSKTFSVLRDMQQNYDSGRSNYLKNLSSKEMLYGGDSKIPKPGTKSISKNKSDSSSYTKCDKKGDRLLATSNTITSNMGNTRKLSRTISLPETCLLDEISSQGNVHCDKQTDGLKNKSVSKLDTTKSQIPQSKEKNQRSCERSKSLQRAKLLSEIVEVEECRDDVLQSQPKKGPNSSLYGPSAEPRVKRPVRHSSKRRSLSLPTGTLAFGEARIVYKNGHFTIETMDGNELDSSRPISHQPCYTGKQELTNQMPMYNNEQHIPIRMLPESHNDLQREVTTERPHLRRQVGKTVLNNKSKLIENIEIFDSNIENMSPNQKHYLKASSPLSTMCSKQRGDNYSRSQNSLDVPVNESIEEQMQLDGDSESQREIPVRYHSSSSLPDAMTAEVQRVAQRARRTSSFRQAQEQGSYRLSGIMEDKDHEISRRRTTSLDESQNTDLNQSRISQSSNQNTSFFQRMMARRKSSTETLNLSMFTKQSDSAKDFFSKKISLKGLFKKHRSDSSVSSPLKTQISSTPPVIVFRKDDDINATGSAPSSPFSSKNMRRRHTSADLFSRAFKEATPSSQPSSNCSTPTGEKGPIFRCNSTPGQEVSFIVRTDKSTPARESNMCSDSRLTSPEMDEDDISIKSTSSASSSVHSAQSQPAEQPHKPKTPKPVGMSPRRTPSSGSQSSQTSRLFSYRDRDKTMSVTSLESETSETVFEDYSDFRCECENLTPTLTRTRRFSSTSDSPVFQQKCDFCVKHSADFDDTVKVRKFWIGQETPEDQGRLQKDAIGRLAMLVQTEISASNSNDSGIQHDVSVHSSSESLKNGEVTTEEKEYNDYKDGGDGYDVDEGFQTQIKAEGRDPIGTPESKIRLRRQKSTSPRPERPKSEIGVRWADLDGQEYDTASSPVRRRDRSQNIKDRPRPKSDFESNIQLFDELFLEVLEDFEAEGSSFFSDRMKAFGSEINLQPYCSLRNLYEMRRRDWENAQNKNRRMSTPHPIKSRLQRTPKRLQKQAPLVRSSSMPESLDKVHKRRKLHHLLDFHEASLSKHMDIDECLSDDSDLSFDHISLQEKSLSVRSSQSQLTSMDEEEDNLTYAEALWDHITMDPEELGFRAGDLINVFDMSDKDWWFGEIEDRDGWFPAAFVRLRVNQDQFEDELEVTLQAELSSSPKLRRFNTINKVQARSNVVNEIIGAEREYVKHLKDVVEGYIQHARKRHEMFSEERLSLIFGNIESIYSFAQKFLSQLEVCIDVCPHLSEIGQSFLDNKKGFEIYSDYCNNHPSACEELKELYKNAKYRHFFEACRLLQELVEIPLEGFLLTPVQKICKYPLQLAELLKYTPPEHADYNKVKEALYEMRKIATLINERKRKMESIEKIAAWQNTVVDWEGEDLLERSSELIFSGDINKINSAGWSQERYFFLFDHQLIYCKKELLKRHVFSYKGRIDLDHCDIVPISDGKDAQYNVTVKHGWKLHETHKDKWYLLYAKTTSGKDRWLKALADERKRVREDLENEFCVPDHWKQTVLNKVRSQSSIKEKHHTHHRPTPDSHLMLSKDLSLSVPYATLPRVRRISSQKHEKKKGWSLFGGKKSKR